MFSVLFITLLPKGKRIISIGIYALSFIPFFQDLVEYKKKHRILKVRTLDDTIKTLQVDDSCPIGMLMVTICTRLGKFYFFLFLPLSFFVFPSWFVFHFFFLLFNFFYCLFLYFFFFVLTVKSVPNKKLTHTKLVK